jgi:Na+/H+-dicarboxylate symporter
VLLRLIKMIIAPLVLATVVFGITGTGDTKEVGRIGIKALGWFVTAPLVSLLLGMVLANFFQPAANLKLPLPDTGLSSAASPCSQRSGGSARPRHRATV